jgi:hypothetical protein
MALGAGRTRSPVPKMRISVMSADGKKEGKRRNIWLSDEHLS